ASTARVRNDGTLMPGTRKPLEYLPRDTGWYGRWRPALNKGNDYGIDREQQARESFTGIEGIHTQDSAVTESMGPITDHDGEHLTVSDLMISRAQRRFRRVVVAGLARGLRSRDPQIGQPDRIAASAAGGGIVSPSRRARVSSPVWRNRSSARS